ncbi:hypothetical protein EYF80_033050 [Liparis tanakae]|uniref:Uncharacterized protein n=1 Tax=Liparis tanakae TaxID=230148 RepID=A0A4Z2GU84_9TELE|nr:hypothetical protein EYF80_033050 [Liparis tanakae]
MQPAPDLQARSSSAFLESALRSSRVTRAAANRNLLARMETLSAPPRIHLRQLEKEKEKEPQE